MNDGACHLDGPGRCLARLRILLRADRHPSLIAGRCGAAFLVLGLVLPGGTFRLEGAPAPAPPGIQVPPGFRVLPFAGPEMADDIRSITVDAQGRVLVSGPGYVRYLLDDDGNGMAESAVEVTGVGGVGMALWGDDLLLMAGEGLQRFADADGDGIPDPFSELWLAIDAGEWGGHAVRLGPDGAVHVLGGHAAGFSAHLAGLVDSPIIEIEGGALVRLATDGAHTEVLADGFYDVRDVAFLAEGDLFTWDNGREPGVPLPGHQRPRLLPVEHGGHHGWRHEGDEEGTFRPEEDPRGVPGVASLAHGLVSGLVCYRHYQFPHALRNGLFAADWAQGRVHHVALEPDGSSYRAVVRPFIESAARGGFAPSGLAVARDGSLLVATGGRKARGGVYLVQYVADPEFLINATNWSAYAATDLVLAMESPQPDGAWSRRLWIAVARNLGPAAFEAVVMDPDQDPLRRVRAIEILVEVFDGVSAEVAAVAARNGPPVVRARVAWALGRHGLPEVLPLLGALANDGSPYVRRQALALMGDGVRSLPLPFVQQVIALNLAAPDARVRRQCARLASRLPDAAWVALWERRLSSAWPARATLLQARIQRTKGLDADAIGEGLALVADAATPVQRGMALRLTQAGLGARLMADDAFPTLPPGAVLEAELRSRLEEVVSSQLDTPEADVHREATRLLAMIRSARPGLSQRLAERIPAQTSDGEVFHLLGVLAMLEDAAPTGGTDPVAGGVLRLGYQSGQEEPVLSERWMTALLPVLRVLVARDRRLASALVNHPRFGEPEHARLVPLLGSEHFLAAARRLYEAASRQPRYHWRAETVDAVAGLPEPARLDLLRRQWSRVTLRDRLILALAHDPVESDRTKYVWGLRSDDEQVVESSLMALSQLPPDPDGRRLAVLIQLLEELRRRGGGGALTTRALELVARQTGMTFNLRDPKTSIQTALDWFREHHAGWVRELDGPGTPHRVTWASRMRSVRWDDGDPGRGAVLFRQLGCAYCHEGSREMGAYLGGYAATRDPEEVLEAVAYPDRECDPHDRVTVVLLEDGTRHEGAVIHDSAEVLILQSAAPATIRVPVREVAQRFKERRSLMPAGLVNDLRPAALADLHAYLKSLPAPVVPSTPR